MPMAKKNTMQVVDSLKGKIAEEIADNNGTSLWEKIHQKNIDYFLRNCVGYPWTNHLALAMLIKGLHNQDPHSIKCSQVSLQARFRDLFAYFGLGQQ